MKPSHKRGNFCWVIPAMLLHAQIMVAKATGAEAISPPNVVVVLFDDLGYGEPACYRSTSTLKTPNLDRLAANGMRFTDAHSAASVCTPTRYGLLTGRYPSRIGQYGVLTTYSRPIIPQTRPTVASLLKEHGYDTAIIGKWHLGLDWEILDEARAKVPIDTHVSFGPNQLGFDYFCGFTHARNMGTLIEQEKVVEHLEDVENQPRLIAKAIEWVEGRKADKPFFLYFPMCPPHTPVVPSPEFIGKSTARDEVKNVPTYGDWVYQGDHMLGQLLDSLEKTGLAENTLVIATSDNGAAGRPYPPLRAAKGSIYEGGHRVPFVASWPAKIKPGTVSNATISLNDLFATCVDLLGAEMPDHAAEDSFSILPDLLGTAAVSVREATVHQSHGGDLAIRRGPWKLIFFKTGKRELYHLDSDLGESTDLSMRHPEVVAELTSLMDRYVSEGRSTPGSKQAPETGVSWPALKVD